jgi:regulator of replication initiation timing
MIIDFPLIPKKIEIILLLPAEYSDSTEQMNAEQINGLSTQLNNTSRELVRLHEEIALLRKENDDLKRKVLLQQEAGYYHRHTSTHGDINTDDAAFDHYWSVQDNDLTLWKVPRHLAEVKSAQTGYHGAVEQAFYDECFGEQYGKLKWMRVREMTQADLINGGWKPTTDEDDGLCGCAEEEQAEQDFFEGKEGGVIRWKPQAEDDEEELDSDDDDYEDKMAGKWECRRCGEKKAWSWVFDDLDCYYYCRECLDELEENSEIEKGGDAADYQYKWM